MKKSVIRGSCWLLLLSFSVICTGCSFGSGADAPATEKDPGPVIIMGNSSEDDQKTTDNERETSKEALETSAILHTVTLDYNDGSGQKEQIQIPEGGLLAGYAPYPIKGNAEVVAWSAISGGAAYEAPITESITLYAQWQTFETAVYTPDSLPTSLMNDRHAEIQLGEDAGALSGQTLRIGPSVHSVSFIGGGAIYQNFSILIAERSAPLNMTFDHFAYTSRQAQGLTYGNSSTPFTLNLTVKGICSIDCSDAENTAGIDGVACISVPNLKLAGTGDFVLLAGRGQDGESKPKAAQGNHGEHGGNGGNGGHGISAKSVEILNLTLKVIGGNGGNGGDGGGGTNNGDHGVVRRNGGDGGRGGNGGDAIHADTVRVENAHLTLTSGHGGHGGDGGDSGGFSAVAGIGGDGGNGGNGGAVFSADAGNYSEKSCVCYFSTGNGGDGGDGGTADGTLTSAQDGSDGSYGATGTVHAK